MASPFADPPPFASTFCYRANSCLCTGRGAATIRIKSNIDTASKAEFPIGEQRLCLLRSEVVVLLLASEQHFDPTGKVIFDPADAIQIAQWFVVSHLLQKPYEMSFLEVTPTQPWPLIDVKRMQLEGDPAYRIDLAAEQQSVWLQSTHRYFTPGGLPMALDPVMRWEAVWWDIEFSPMLVGIFEPNKCKVRLRSPRMYTVWSSQRVRATSAPSVDAWAAEAVEEHDDKPGDVPIVPDVDDEVESGREEDAPGDVDESIFGGESTDNDGSEAGDAGIEEGSAVEPSAPATLEPSVPSDGAEASPSGGAPVDEVAADEVAPIAKGGAHVRAEIGNGWVAWYPNESGDDGYFVARCGHEAHRAPDGPDCKIERTSRAGRARWKGRPLGFLVAWIQRVDSEDCTRDNHVHCKCAGGGAWQPSFATRLAAREHLMSLPGGHDLATKEAPQGSAPSPEPA